MARFLLICLGGAIGTGARYLLSGAMARAYGPGFPLGTLLVNLVGSFLIAVVIELSLRGGWISPDLRLFLTTGVMGGFTTYSSFNYESLRYFSESAYAMGLLNMAVTVFGCMAMGILGLYAARWLGA